MPAPTQSIRKPPRVYLRRGHPLAKGLVGVWPFQEGSGATLHDVSEYGRDGTEDTTSGTDNNPGGGWVIGPFGHALNYKGGSDNFTEVDWCGVQGSQNRTAVVRYKSSSASPSTYTDQVWISYGNHTTGERWEFRLDGPNGDVPRVEVSGGNLLGNTDVADTNWHTLGCTLNGSNATDHILYVDGVNDGVSSSASQSMDSNPSCGQKVTFGYSKSIDKKSRRVDGEIDLILFWNRKLTAGEHMWVHRDPLAPFITKPR